MSEDAIQTAILRLVDARGPGKSICPSEVARDVFADDWRARMKTVRAAAVGLARAGRITILRKGRPVDPDDFKGVYRLGTPREDAP